MELQNIIDVIISNFNFGLIISINVLVYSLIKIFEFIFKETAPKLFKVVITIIATFILGFVYLKAGNVSSDVILSSCISAPLIWDWILKPILKKLKADYKS